MKPIVISGLVALLMVVGAILIPSGTETPPDFPQEGNNVALVDGVQTIEVRAKGGYYPRATEAQAGVPTILRVTTRGTFDCSAALTIPSLNYRSTLTPTGEVEIEIPPQEAGSVIQGLCSMGMYNFTLTFK